MTDYSVPDGMTPKALRDIAWTVDQLGRLMTMAMDSVIRGEAMNAGTVRFEFDLVNDDGPLTVEEAKALREWASGTGMQDNIRAWADALDVAASANDGGDRD